MLIDEKAFPKMGRSFSHYPQQSGGSDERGVGANLTSFSGADANAAQSITWPKNRHLRSDPEAEVLT